MKRFVFLLVFIQLLSLCTFAQTDKVPGFEQYSVKAERIKAKAPNLKSHKDARLFRTNLQRAARHGVNFAGHYALTYWGCGASCGVGAIVNLKTGTVFFPKQLDGVWAQDWPENPDKEAPFDYRKDSRLLVLFGYLPGDYAGDRETYGYHYFVWNGSTLRRVKFVPKDWRNGE